MFSPLAGSRLTARDGAPWTMGGEAGRHVLRSGSWKDKAPQLTSSFRRGAKDDTRDDAIGLRCVLADK